MNTTGKVILGAGAVLVVAWVVNTPRQILNGAIHHSQPRFKDTTGVPIPLGGFKIRLRMSVSNISNIAVQVNGASGKVVSYDALNSGKIKDSLGTFVIRDQKTAISPNETKEFLIEIEPNIIKLGLNLGGGTFLSEQWRIVGNIFTTLGTFKIDEEIGA